MVADHQGGEHQGGMNPSEARQDDFRLWQILLQKSFCEVGLKFSDP